MYKLSLYPFCNIHTHKFLSNNNIQIVNRHLQDSINENEFFSLGIHPMALLNTNVDADICKIKEKLQHKNLIAIGEVGIDRRCKKTIEKQIDVFERINNLAISKNKPVIVHCVRAWSDLMHIRKLLNISNIWIFHGFNANYIIAKTLIENGCYLSFGDALIYNKKLQQTFKQIPLEYVFLETDDANVDIEKIYEKAMSIKKITLEELKKIIYNNFVKVFGNIWKPIG